MRLYDHVMQRDWHPKSFARELIRQWVRFAVVVDAANVARWIGDTYRARGAAWGEIQRDLTRCVPPFQSTFVEWVDDGVPVGVSVWRMPRDEPGLPWGLEVSAFFLNRDTGIAERANNVVSVVLNDDGTPHPEWRCTDPGTLEPVYDQSEWEALWEYATIALWAFRFMNCANVALVERQAPRGERRRVAREGGRPLTTYRTIEVHRDVRRAVSAATRSNAETTERALHICRGHFADYTKGAGLFGKHKVQVFVPEHLRGTGRRGVVVSDYRLRNGGAQ